MQCYDSQELIAKIQQLANELGRTPTQREFGKGEAQAASRRFDSWDKFLGVAGLKRDPHKRNRQRHFSKEDLIDEVRMLADELGRSPTAEEFDVDPRTASKQTVINNFGKWTDLLRAAGLKTRKRGERK